MNELRDTLARAMRAQGKVDPDEVFARVDSQPDTEFGRCVECGRPLTTEEAIRSDACLSCDPPDDQQVLPLGDEDDGVYGDWRDNPGNYGE